MAVTQTRHMANEMRVHDYLYDPAFVVSGARDFARSAFRAAMASAQIKIKPIYQTMFCEIRRMPSYQVEYHPNCRLPGHMDRSYGAAMRKVDQLERQPPPDLGGRDRFRFFAAPREVMSLSSVTPQLSGTPLYTSRVEVPTPPPRTPGPPVNRSMQTQFRESSAQTQPWQPAAKVAEISKETPEVLYLDKLQWGPGDPYRTGDLPADFHTTEIINKMRHARIWTELVEHPDPTRGTYSRDAVITDVETRDWLFREAEIDELQELRLHLLREETAGAEKRRVGRVRGKLERLWRCRKRQMESKVDGIRRTRDRELRKLRAAHFGARPAERRRAERGGGPALAAAADPASDVHAPRARHGYQARGRHAEITYYPDILGPAEQARLCAPPAWLRTCGSRLARTCSGHARARDPTQLCERETRWNEGFLRDLHMSLKQARLGAAADTAGPCRLLKPRGGGGRAARPATPTVEALPEEEEAAHQDALALQRALRGRAVQLIMMEGRTRAAELTEELKTTHGLQPRDKERVRRERLAARDLQAREAQLERREREIEAVTSELCGGALSAALGFLEKELRRLRAERREQAFVIVATRDKHMREAAEAGRRQLEERRRREHDAIFKQVIGVTQETVDAYMRDIIRDGAELCAEEQAAARAELEADAVERDAAQQGAMSTYEQNELVAELVHRLALPEAQRRQARRELAAAQGAGLAATRDAIFGHIDSAERITESCARCGRALGDTCRCVACPVRREPQARPEYRGDPRWRYIRRAPQAAPRDIGERFPPAHDFRCMLDAMVDEAVAASRTRGEETSAVRRDAVDAISEHLEVGLDCKQYVEGAVEIAIGAAKPPARRPEYRHLMYRRVVGAIDRDAPKETAKCPELLPSELRELAEYQKYKPILEKGFCVCEDSDTSWESLEDTKGVLPSQLRTMEQQRRCKCDEEPSAPPPPSPADAETLSVVEERSESAEDVVMQARDAD